MKNQELIRYGSATTIDEARALAAAEAHRRFGKLSDDRLERGVQDDHQKVKLYASRAFNNAIILGLRFKEMKGRLPRGEFEPACERLRFSKTVVHAYRTLAELWPLLPDAPPDGGVWSVDRALTYAKTAGEVADDLDVIEGVTPAAMQAKVQAKLEKRRKAKASAQLAGAIVRLESQVRQALAEGDTGAIAAVGMIAQTLQRLEDDVRRYAEDADAHRAQDDDSTA
jgi:hypothetical protein